MKGLPLLCCVAALLVACQKPEEHLYEPSDPRPATPVETAQAEVTYRLVQPSEVRFTQKSKDFVSKGSLNVIRGELHINLQDLSKSHGTIDVDLAALRMGSFDSPEENRLQAERARAWLNLGASRPEALKEQLRWARFRFKQLSHVTPEAAWRGKLREKLYPPSSEIDAGGGVEIAPQPKAAPTPAPRLNPNQDIELNEVEEEPEAGAPSGPRRLVGEIRSSAGALEGELELNNFRKTISAPFEARFEFAEPATASLKPVRVQVKSTRPAQLRFVDYDIRPRNAHGVPDTSQAEWAKRTGAPVQFEFELQFEPN